MCTAALGMFEFLEHDHRGAFAQHEAVAHAVEGARGLRGFVVAGGQGGQQIEAGDAEGVNHAVGAAGNHAIGIPAADDFGGFADRLAAGRASRQAVQVRPLGVEHAGEMAGRHVRFLFQFGHRVERFPARLGEARQVQSIAVQGGAVIMRVNDAKSWLPSPQPR